MMMKLCVIHNVSFYLAQTYTLFSNHANFFCFEDMGGEATCRKHNLEPYCGGTLLRVLKQLFFATQSYILDFFFFLIHFQSIRFESIYYGVFRVDVYYEVIFSFITSVILKHDFKEAGQFI